MAVEHKDMANAIRALSMDAVEQAMCMAGYDQKEFDRMRTGVFVGVGLFSSKRSILARSTTARRRRGAVASKFSRTGNRSPRR